MSKNIYVGNLSYKCSDADLRQVFEAYGQVTSAKIVMDRETGKSRGFGFVEMDVPAAAEEAITKLNGSDFNGRRLVVNEARPRKEGPPREG